MKQNILKDKSYSKSNAVRRKMREELFQKNRHPSTLSYLEHYDKETQELIKQSMEGPIPVSLPPVSELSLLNISYYRRSNANVFKTRQQADGPIDPHMAYESLFSLAAVEELTQFPNWQQVVQQFENDLSAYLKMPYHEVREMAIIAAGNRFIGRQPQILHIAQNYPQYFWVLTNHIYQRRLSFKHLIPYMQKEQVACYRLIYEITNNYKDELIYTIMSNQELLSKIFDNLGNSNGEVQTFALRILGNILAEAEDYAGDLTKYHLPDRLFPLLGAKSWETRRDGCWLLANYVFESAAANEILCKQNLVERLMIMYRNEQRELLRIQLYYILTHLVQYANKPQIYNLALTENFLEQCSLDLQDASTDLSLLILNLIEKLIELGSEYLDSESTEPEDAVNPFIHYIRERHLRLQIVSKTYSQNQEISQLSANILELVGKEDHDFQMS